MFLFVYLFYCLCLFACLFIYLFVLFYSIYLFIVNGGGVIIHFSALKCRVLTNRNL